MWQDPIVEEIRSIREAHAGKFNYDLHAICEDFRKNQILSGRTIVSRPARRPATYVAQQGAPADRSPAARVRIG